MCEGRPPWRVSPRTPSSPQAWIARAPQRDDGCVSSSEGQQCESYVRTMRPRHQRPSIQAHRGAAGVTRPGGSGREVHHKIAVLSAAHRPWRPQFAPQARPVPCGGVAWRPSRPSHPRTQTQGHGEAGPPRHSRCPAPKTRHACTVRLECRVCYSGGSSFGSSQLHTSDTLLHTS
jgi:hypothetical protein